MTKLKRLHSMEVELALQLCDKVGSSFAQRMSMLITAEDWITLATIEIDPKQYHDVQQFADDYMLSRIFTKSLALPVKLPLEAMAVAKFYDAEQRCAETNRRLYGAVKPQWFYDFQAYARNVMGNLSNSALTKIISMAKHGPGASTGVESKGLVPSIKYKNNNLHCTPNLVPFVRQIMGETWWSHYHGAFVVVAGNKYQTVPKKATALRGICSEPDLNVFFQLGIGRYLQMRLLKFGVDLELQELNQELALRAFDWGLATIDLSQASDLMARAAVSETVTTEWDHLLNIARSPQTFMPDGTFVSLEKHSSMGNGYTFPLETILFLSAVRCTVPRDLWAQTAVYGDDIIVPRQYASTVIDRLEYLGFQVNRTKTHLAGAFFESCGVDTFQGVDVTPFYLRQDPNKALTPFKVYAANRLRLWAGRSGTCDSRFRPIWESLVKGCPKTWRDCKVPVHFGDQGIIESDLAHGCPEAKDFPITAGLEGYRVKFLGVKPRKADLRKYGLLLTWLASSTSREEKESQVGLPCIHPNDRNQPIVSTASERSVRSWRESLSHLSTQSEGFTFGKEPMRGYLGRVVPRTSVTLWPKGLRWDDEGEIS